MPRWKSLLKYVSLFKNSGLGILQTLLAFKLMRFNQLYIEISCLSRLVIISQEIQYGPCGGLNENCPINAYIWILAPHGPQLVEMSGRDLGGVALLEEVCQWGWALGVQNPTPFPLSTYFLSPPTPSVLSTLSLSSFTASWLLSLCVSSQLLLQHHAWLPTILILPILILILIATYCHTPTKGGLTVWNCEPHLQALI